LEGPEVEFLRAMFGFDTRAPVEVSKLVEAYVEVVLTRGKGWAGLEQDTSGPEADL
jgi:hypothetical protein